MVPEWRERRLGEITDNFDGIRIPVKETDRHRGRYPYYGASGIVDYVEKYLFDGEYLLIAEDGENLRTRNTPVAFLAKGKFWVNNHAHIVRGNIEADTRFLMYVLSTKDISGYLTGSTMPKLTQANMNQIPVLAPPVSEQRAIAYILGALDDKIELNRKMNATFEAMARAIFKSWFLDFEPVRVRMEGRQSIGMNAETTALFPENFEDSAFGKIPKGWTVNKLGDILLVIETGYRPPGGVRNVFHGVPSIGAESIVGLGQFDYGKTKFVPRDFFEAMKRGHVAEGDVLLYKDGGRPGEFEPHLSMSGKNFPFTQCCINEHVYRLRANPRCSQNYLFFWLSSELIMEEMRNRGTGVAVPGLNSTAVRDLPILLPSDSLMQTFEKRIAPLINRIFTKCNESRILAAIRDALLPKLLSGEIRVKEAQQLTC